MLNTRRLLLLLPLAACAVNPVTDNEFMLADGDVVRGAADGVRTAAFSAQRAFGDTSLWHDNPIAACFGMAQLEYLYRNFTTNPRFTNTATFETIHSLREGQRALRQAVNIPTATDSRRLENDLRIAVRELSSGNRAAADAALAAYGPDLIGRLTSLPRIREVQFAASAAATEFGTSRGGNQGRL
jgi:hypothetical protein